MVILLVFICHLTLLNYFNMILKFVTIKTWRKMTICLVYSSTIEI